MQIKYKNKENVLKTFEYINENALKSFKKKTSYFHAVIILNINFFKFLFYKGIEN